jgi:glutamate--cysteine ligase
MPCGLPADETIPIGNYGSRNVGRAKSVYRMGLGHRYGRRMQTISGIHYNWSLPGLSNDEYFALIRNFRRHSFLLLYLFGASPAVCGSFVGRPRPRAAALGPERHAAPAARHHAAHGPAGLPERRAGRAGGQLQQPGELRQSLHGR